MVDLEWLGAFRDLLFCLGHWPCESYSPLHYLWHDDQDEPLGPMGHARFQLPSSTWLFASSPLFVGLGISELSLRDLRVCHLGLCWFGRGQGSGSVVFHHDHLGEQVVCTEGLLHLPHADQYMCGVVALCLPLDRFVGHPDLTPGGHQNLGSTHLGQGIFR